MIASSTLVPVAGFEHTGKLTALPHSSRSSLMWRTVQAAFQLPLFQSSVKFEVHSGIALSTTSMPGPCGCTWPAAPTAS